MNLSTMNILTDNCSVIADPTSNMEKDWMDTVNRNAKLALDEKLLFLPIQSTCISEPIHVHIPVSTSVTSSTSSVSAITLSHTAIATKRRKSIMDMFSSSRIPTDAVTTTASNTLEKSKRLSAFMQRKSQMVTSEDATLTDNIEEIYTKPVAGLGLATSETRQSQGGECVNTNPRLNIMVWDSIDPTVTSTYPSSGSPYKQHSPHTSSTAPTSGRSTVQSISFYSPIPANNINFVTLESDNDDDEDAIIPIETVRPLITTKQHYSVNEPSKSPPSLGLSFLRSILNSFSSVSPTSSPTHAAKNPTKSSSASPTSSPTHAAKNPTKSSSASPTPSPLRGAPPANMMTRNNTTESSPLHMSISPSITVNTTAATSNTTTGVKKDSPRIPPLQFELLNTQKESIGVKSVTVVPKKCRSHSLFPYQYKPSFLSTTAFSANGTTSSSNDTNTDTTQAVGYTKYPARRRSAMPILSSNTPFENEDQSVNQSLGAVDKERNKAYFKKLSEVCL